MDSEDDIRKYWSTNIRCERAEATIYSRAHRKWLYSYCWICASVRCSLISVSSWVRLNLNFIICFDVSGAPCFVSFNLGTFFHLFVFVFISFSTFGYACLTFDGWLMSKLQVCIWTFSSNSFEHSPSRSHTEEIRVCCCCYNTLIDGGIFFAFLFHHRKNTAQAVNEEQDNVRQSRHRKKFSSNRYRTHSYITLSVIRCSLLTTAASRCTLVQRT